MTLNHPELYGLADVLHYFDFLCLLCIPFAFLLKKPPKEAQGAA